MDDASATWGKHSEVPTALYSGPRPGAPAAPPHMEGEQMKRLGTKSIAIAGALALFVVSAHGQEKKPDATVEFSGGTVAAGVGFSWGSGITNPAGVVEAPYRGARWLFWATRFQRS